MTRHLVVNRTATLASATLFALAGFADSALATEWCKINRVSIVDPTGYETLFLDCGQSGLITVRVFISKTFNFQGGMEVQLWEEDPGFGDWNDEHISSQPLPIPRGGPTDQTIDVNLVVRCDSQVNRRCLFSGTRGLDDDDAEGFRHTLYAFVGGTSSTLPSNFGLQRIDVVCSKPNGATGCLPANVSPGGTLQTVASLSGNSSPVASMILQMAYDPAIFVPTAAQPDPQFLSAFPGATALWFPGRIVINSGDAAQLWTGGSIVRLWFSTTNYAPLGDSYFAFLPGLSQVWGPGNVPLDVGMGTTAMAVVPADAQAPTIQPDRLVIGPDGLQGLPGSVMDDNLSVPGWVGVRLEYFSEGSYGQLLGAFADVNPDGSFSIPGPLPGGQYRLVATDGNSHSSSADLLQPVAVEDREASPKRLELRSSYPNPFASRTRFDFALPNAGAVRLAVYDPGGREVAILVDRELSPGWHSVSWDGRDETGAVLSPGIYIARLSAAGQTRTRKTVLER